MAQRSGKPVAIAMEISDMRNKLAIAIAKEKIAMRRLRRAQTLYDKYYDRRTRLQDQITEAYDQADRIADRLLATHHSKEK